MTGETLSTDFPTANALDSTLGGSGDAFVAKLNASGTALAWSTYLGGGQFDSSSGIAVDGSGNAYVTGTTTSTDFPGAAGSPIQNAHGGGSTDAFVAKLNAAGTALVYSTYLGGSSDESGSGIAVDAAGNAYVAGTTISTDFPMAGSPIQSTFGGLSDAFVAKLNAAGTVLARSTYLGGGGTENGFGLAVDASGNVYVTDRTTSTDFPGAAGSPIQNMRRSEGPLNGGNTDAFVAKIGILISPAGTIFDTTPAYTWNAVPEATWYQLWVNDSTGNRIKQWFAADQAGCPGGTGTCSVTPTAVLKSGSAIWWVRAWNSTAGNFPWSGGMSFTVAGSLGAPTPNSPAGTIFDATPAYSWNAVAGATLYLLAVDDSTGRRINQWFKASSVGCAGGTGTCSVTPSTALNAGSGRWWVRGWNSSLGSGPWSAGMSFAVPGPLTPPTLVSPTGAIADTTPTYTWNAVANSTWYQLWVNDSSGNRIKQWFTSAQAGCAGGTGICSVTPTTPIGPGSGNKWWVRGWNSLQRNGPWSGGMAFTVVLPPPATVSPSGEITDPTPAYTWNAVFGATWYLLWVDDRSGNRIKQWFTATQVGCPNGTGTCSTTPAAILRHGAAKWWVRAWNSTEGGGPWSARRDFSVNLRPVLISPSGTVPTTTPTYSWNAMANAAWYQLWVDDSTGNRIIQWLTATQVGCASGTGTCSTTPTTALNAGAGTWWVRSWNSQAGSGPWSAGRTFTVAP